MGSTGDGVPQGLVPPEPDQAGEITFGGSRPGGILPPGREKERDTWLAKDRWYEAADGEARASVWERVMRHMMENSWRSCMGW